MAGKRTGIERMQIRDELEELCKDMLRVLDMANEMKLISEFTYFRESKMKREFLRYHCRNNTQKK